MYKYIMAFSHEALKGSFKSHIERFFSSPNEAETAIMLILGDHPKLNKAQIFQLLTAYKGPGKSHASGKPEDGLKDS